MAHDSPNARFSEAEKQNMKARARELAAEQRAERKRGDGEQDVLSALEAMDENDREIGMTFHQLVSEIAPNLWPKTWYGMPAYAIGGKKVVCFYKSANKGEERYATIGFSDLARLDDGDIWPSSYAILRMSSGVERFLRELLTRATHMLPCTE